MKAALARLGIGGFNPQLGKAADGLEDLLTPEGEPSARNTLPELRRDVVRRLAMHKYGKSTLLGSSVSSRRPRWTTRHGPPAGAGGVDQHACRSVYHATCVLDVGRLESDFGLGGQLVRRGVCCQRLV